MWMEWFQDDEASAQAYVEELEEQACQGSYQAAVMALWMRMVLLKEYYARHLPWRDDLPEESHLKKAEEAAYQALGIVREHAYAQWSGRGLPLKEEFHLQNLPHGMELKLYQDGTVCFELPMWMFAGNQRKGMGLRYRRGLPYVLDKPFWDALIHALVEPVQFCIPYRVMDTHRRLRFLLHSVHPYVLRDVDHYNLSPMINALKDQGGLLYSDSPEFLALSIEWIRSPSDAQKKDGGRVEIRIENWRSEPEDVSGKMVCEASVQADERMPDSKEYWPVISTDRSTWPSACPVCGSANLVLNRSPWGTKKVACVDCEGYRVKCADQDSGL